MVKKILITGKDSYIGIHVKEWLGKEANQYEVTELDVKTQDWLQEDFSKYDTILHVAGIAHVSTDKKLEDLYYKVNRDLAIQVANKAKKENVKQFIFMSSMIIYGDDEHIGEKKAIDKNTAPQPKNFYGNSKLQAEEGIKKLEDENFKTVIIRTPMVYGPNCKGNFPRLKKIAKISLIFPDIENERSMIYIDNLCEFIKQAIDNEKSGTFYPQNKEYISTKQIIKVMAEAMNKKMHFIKLFNPIIRLMSKKINLINKVFGTKIYAKELSGNFDYIVVDNEESIRRSV